MLDKYIKLTHALRLRPRARFYEKSCWLSRRQEANDACNDVLSSLTCSCEPTVSSIRSHGHADTCHIPCITSSSNVDATLGAFVLIGIRRPARRPGEKSSLAMFLATRCYSYPRADCGLYKG